MEINKENKIYPKVEIPFGWRRNLEFVKEQFILMLKTLIEYKSTFYASLIEQIFSTIIMFTFVFVLYHSVGDITGWNFVDFILFTLLVDFIFVISGILTWKVPLSETIINGDLNLYLSKPINIFSNWLFSKLTPATLFYVFSDIFLFIFIYFYFKFSYFNLFLFFLFLFLIIILVHSFRIFMFSLALIKIKLDEIIFDIYGIISGVVGDYPAPFFDKAFFKYSLFILPSFFIGSLLIPVLRGYDFMFDPYLQVGIILGLIIIFGVGTWLNWHYGLKKYEAFG